MATRRKGSSKYRSMRNGQRHSADDCAICAGKPCRVIVSNPVDGEFEAQLTPLLDGRTRLEGVRPILPPNRRRLQLNGLSGFRTDPRLGEWEGPKYDPEALKIHSRVHIPSATLLAMQALQTWGARYARL